MSIPLVKYFNKGERYKDFRSSKYKSGGHDLIPLCGDVLLNFVSDIVI